MTEAEFDAKLAELDRLLNDPEVRLDPERVWALAAQLSPPEAMPGRMTRSPRPGQGAGAA